MAEKVIKSFQDNFKFLTLQPPDNSESKTFATKRKKFVELIKMTCRKKLRTGESEQNKKC